MDAPALRKVDRRKQLAEFYTDFDHLVAMGFPKEMQHALISTRRHFGRQGEGQASGDHYAWTNEEFLDFLRQVKAFTEAIGKPMMLWQIPLGNATLDNTYGPYDKYGNRPSGRWVDDKVKHFFDNMEKVADAHIVGLMFGAGYTEGTGTESDGGYFLKRALEYYARGGQPLK